METHASIVSKRLYDRHYTVLILIVLDKNKTIT